MSAVTSTARASYAFMVWRKSKGRPPRFRHETIEAATGEVERLAAANPGATFVVLQEISRFTAYEPAAATPPAVTAEPGDHPPRSPGSKEARLMRSPVPEAAEQCCHCPICRSDCADIVPCMRIAPPSRTGTASSQGTCHESPLEES